jgi:hypothetical protein
VGLIQLLALDRRAMPPAALEHRRPPALDGGGHDRHGLIAAGSLDEAVKRAGNRVRIMTVDAHDRHTRRLEFRGQPLRRLLRADLIRLAVPVAVEDRQDVGQRLVHDEVDRLRDLPLAGLAVADDAVNPLVEAVAPGGHPEARRHRQALAQGSGGGIEERDPLHGAGMALEAGVGLP